MSGFDLSRKNLERQRMDGPSVAGFGGQLCYMVVFGEVMADSKTENFKRLNLLSWLMMEITARWMCLTIIPEGHDETEIFLGLKHMFQVFDQ